MCVWVRVTVVACVGVECRCAHAYLYACMCWSVWIIPELLFIIASQLFALLHPYIGKTDSQSTSCTPDTYNIWIEICSLLMWLIATLCLLVAIALMAQTWDLATFVAWSSASFCRYLTLPDIFARRYISEKSAWGRGYHAHSYVSEYHPLSAPDGSGSECAESTVLILDNPIK